VGTHTRPANVSGRNARRLTRNPHKTTIDNAMPLLGFLTAKNVIYCICWSQRFWYRFHSIALVLIMDATMRVQSRSWNWSRKQSEFFGWSRIPNNTGSRSWIFLSDSRCSIGSFFTSLLKLGIPVKMVQFLLKLLLKQISCCAPRFPLILTAKFHSFNVKGSESEIWKGRCGESEILQGSELESKSDILPPTPQPWPEHP